LLSLPSVLSATLYQLPETGVNWPQPFSAAASG